MLISIEGLAHTGKSTLVAALRKSPFIKHTHKYSKEDAPNLVEWMNGTLVDHALDSWVHVTDRGHGTEYVYSNLYNRRTPYTSLDFWQLDMKLAKAGTMIVYLTQPHNVLHARYKETGRRPEGDLPEIEGLYEQFLLDTACKVLRIDQRFTLEETVEVIKRYIKEAA